MNIDRIMDAINGDNNALNDAFIWSNTVQGIDYWAAQACGDEPIDVATLKEMIATNVNKDELAGALVWSTLNQRDPELTSPYGDNNPPVSDTPKTWGDMTDAEKGALLLADLRGIPIQCKMEDVEWFGGVSRKWCWIDNCAYRIKPEPKRETVKLCGYIDRGYFHIRPGVNDTHRITFDLIDGEPDTDSIRMEEL